MILEFVIPSIFEPHGIIMSQPQNHPQVRGGASRESYRRHPPHQSRPGQGRAALSPECRL